MKEIKKVFEKTFVRDGKRLKFSVTVRLNDECKNNISTFHIAGKTEIFCFGEWKLKSCGGCVEDAEKFFPELVPFLKLNGCNYLGQPSYPIDNGMYYGKRYKEDCKKYLRITEEEYNALLPAIKLEDDDYFKYLLFKLGIVDRWRNEAENFIQFLTGSRNGFESPYKEEEERFVLRLSKKESDAVEEAIEAGAYTDDAIFETLLTRKEEQAKAARKEVIQRYMEEEEKLRRERDVKLYIIDRGLPVNVIYYHHDKSAVFNWLECSEQVTKEQFDSFVKDLEYNKLPDGIKFYFGKKEQN